MVRDWLGQNKIMRVGKNSGLVLSRLCTKVHEILGQRRRPPIRTFQRTCQLSMSRFIQQIFATKSRSRRKTEQMWKFFGPNFLVGTTLTFLRRIVSATYRQQLGTVWLSSFCWSPPAKPGNEVECRFYGRQVKTHVQFEAFCGPKFMSFWHDVGDPL